ncbi:MAG: protein ybjQ [Gemmatimonadetes bacterium]|nr:protein ybjQ [Gemmatimonadota bacterium]
MQTLNRPSFIATTANQLDGYSIEQTLGLVRGITVRSRSVVGLIGARLQTVFGGNISILTDLCEQTRAEAYETCVVHARALGGNALIAMRYDATEIMPGVSEVLCYGTAVIARPNV